MRYVLFLSIFDTIRKEIFVELNVGQSRSGVRTKRARPESTAVLMQGSRGLTTIKPAAFSHARHHRKRLL